MRRLFPLLASTTVAAIALVQAGLAGAAQSTPPATVQVSKSHLGQILVDSRGRTLYLFEQDTSKASTCYGACAALWPPLLTSGAPHAGHGASASLIGTTKRKDGKTEVTYNGHPLYYYVSDTKAGQTTGQALNQFGALWYVLSPGGRKIDRDGS